MAKLWLGKATDWRGYRDRGMVVPEAHVSTLPVSFTRTEFAKGPSDSALQAGPKGPHTAVPHVTHPVTKEAFAFRPLPPLQQKVHLT
jgi:hypothetical protein